jgi:condensin-2 complex subunit G2
VTKRNTEGLWSQYLAVNSLRCANGIVRSQAAGPLFKLLPIEELRGQCVRYRRHSAEAVKDDDHRVRVVSVAGVCNVLNVYWEVLPSPVKHQVLTVVVGTLALDSSSAGVRLAVVNGLTRLLEQRLTHTTLKKMIPLLAPCIHDNSKQVRIAFVQLLCKVKTTRGISFLCSSVSSRR